jgi:alpha-glucan,water dikinase
MESISKMTMTGKPAPEGPLPEISNELCGIWAYIKWEEAGCPNRSQEESDMEYRAGIIEMQKFLQQGITMDELWKARRSFQGLWAF